MIAEAQKEFDKAGTYVTQQKTKNAEVMPWLCAKSPPEVPPHEP